MEMNSPTAFTDMLDTVFTMSRYLGQMYKAEALAAVDKIAEGLGLLSPEESVDPKMFGGEKSEGSQSMLIISQWTKKHLYYV